MIPTVILVGADKGGVGKTMLSRCLLDYLRAHGRPVRAFDTQVPLGDLVRFNDATLVDITTIEGQMAIFDGAVADTLTVVDLCAGVLSPTIRALDDAQLLDQVRNGAMNLVLLHVLGPSAASIDELSRAANEIGNSRHLLVKNHINKTKFSLSGIPGADHLFKQFADVTITVPQLPETAAETLQELAGRGDASFAGYATDINQSVVLRGNVGSWLRKVWAEFDRVNLIDG